MCQVIEVSCQLADRGRFDEALRLIRSLAETAREYAAGLALQASIWRQVRRHDLAEQLDLAGLKPRVPDALGTTMCALGLAADRVGQGDAQAATELLQRGDAALADLAPWHWATRWFDPWVTRSWVAAEVFLLTDQPDRAVIELEQWRDSPMPKVPNTRWPYERAKTLLFLGVAELTAGDRDRAQSDLQAAAELAIRAGYVPLILPIAELLAELQPERTEFWQGQVRAAKAQLARHEPGQAGSTGPIGAAE